MKKAFLTVAAALSLSYAQAQNFSFGVKAGLNVSGTNGDNANNLLQDESGELEIRTQSMTGFHLGLVGNFGLTDMVSIQPELLYATKGFQIDKDFEFDGVHVNIAGTQKLDYIDVPILININTGRFSFEVGPQFSYLVSASTNLKLKATYMGETETAKPKNYKEEGFKNIDLGYALGLKYNFENGLFLGVRYSGGFASIFDEEHTFTDEELYDYAYVGGEDGSERPDLKNYNFQFTFGYMIPGGK